MLKSSSLCFNSSNLDTFWLKIEQFWPFEEISIFSNGDHLGYRTALTDTILKGDHPMIISAKFATLKPLGQFEPNFGGMVLGWPPSKIVSGDPDFQPRWPPS
jgi:hypothetical protein